MDIGSILVAIAVGMIIARFIGYKYGDQEGYERGWKQGYQSGWNRGIDAERRATEEDKSEQTKISHLEETTQHAN